MTPEKYESMRKLLEDARAGDQTAREALVRENLPLVHHLVKRFQDRGREYDDLFQYGCLGLLKAISARRRQRACGALHQGKCPAR